MSELLSHPLDPLGARVLVPVGRAGVPAPFALRSQHNRLGVRVGRWARNPSGPARGTIPRETAASPSKRREPASFRRRVPDSVAACLVSASFHRFAPLLPLIGSFRAYRRRAIDAINGLALSSIPPPIHAQGTCWTEPVPPSSVQPILSSLRAIEAMPSRAIKSQRRSVRPAAQFR
jgi:hypothetical protein